MSVLNQTASLFLAPDIKEWRQADSNPTLVPPDASIWLFQFMRAMRDDRGEMVKNAHLKGFFSRICRWGADAACVRV